MDAQSIDNSLLEQFNCTIWNKVPHIDDEKHIIVNPTSLIDLTDELVECAKMVYSIDLQPIKGLKILCKLDSELPTGSIKMRPAAQIVHDAIITGKLKKGGAIIEATSGNFGIALGQIGTKLGLVVISLVSRRLQEGVFEGLRSEGVHPIDLDMDVCPAPGMEEGSRDVLAARAAAANIRTQLLGLGFDIKTFDDSIKKVEEMLAAQDAINLAKLLAQMYGCFCPEQYDNQLNIEAHRTVTGPEMDQQLHTEYDGESLKDYKIICAFGTGGTSGGLNKYITEKYDKSNIHVVFPPVGQDVAGIRTKATADGLSMYNPEAYETQHEIDFEKARHLFRFFVEEKNMDIGESSALAMYTAMQMASTNNNKKFIVIIADGIAKYRKTLKASLEKKSRIQVSLQDAVSSVDEYDRVVWVHPQYTPREEGIKIIAKSLGINTEKITISKAVTVNKLLATREVTEEMSESLKGTKGKCLLVCMAGNTSLMATKVLAEKGIIVESLSGGITGLPEGMMRNPGELVRVATE